MNWTKSKIAMVVSSTVIVTACATTIIEAKISAARSHSQPATIFADTTLQLSPFTSLKFTDDGVMVGYQGAVYRLAAIDGVTTDAVLEHCAHAYGKSMARKRFAEDLVIVLHDLGHPLTVDHSVSLALTDLKTGETTQVEHAVMTAANRSAVFASLHGDNY